MHSVDIPSIRKIINDNKLQLLARKECDKAITYIAENFPGMSNGLLYWEKYDKKYKQLKWEDVDDKVTIDFLKSTIFNKYKTIGLIYYSDQPGIVGDFYVICNNLDKFLRPMNIFLVGIKLDEECNPHVVPQDFAELNAWGGILTAPVYD